MKLFWEILGKLSLLVSFIWGVVKIIEHFSRKPFLVLEIQHTPNDFLIPYPKSTYQPCASFVFLRLKNVGKVKANNVSIGVPKTYSICVKRDGIDNKAFIENSTGTMELQSIKPSEIIHITLMSSEFGAAYTYLMKSQFKISYDDEGSKIIFMKNVTPFWSFIAENWKWILFMMITGSVGPLLFIYHRK